MVFREKRGRNQSLSTCVRTILSLHNITYRRGGGVGGRTDETAVEPDSAVVGTTNRDSTLHDLVETAQT